MILLQPAPDSVFLREAMRKATLLLLLIFAGACACAQPASGREIKVTVVTGQQAALSNSTVSLFRLHDSTIVRTGITDTTGVVVFNDLPAGNYTCRITRISYRQQQAAIDLQQHESSAITIVLQPEAGLLQDVTVTAKKPFVQVMPDKTIVNVDAGITNAGTSIMEVLEKSPGIIVDRDGNISLKGKQGVQVMIDGKPTQLSGADLSNLLSGMSASQVDQIELMDNPSARYDAAGNAGIINIKTKKNKQKGFNGSVSVAYGQGRYPKNNNSVVFNYRNGSFNFFLNYSLNASKNFTDMFARRTYYKDDGKTPEGSLEQPYFTSFKWTSHNVKAGVDYFVDAKTTLGIAVTGLLFDRSSNGGSNAVWINATGATDSTIRTTTNNDNSWRNGGINFNARRVFSASRELSADIDYLTYKTNTSQYFENVLVLPGAVAEATKGQLPANIQIFSAKTDYSQRMGTALLEAGWKTSHVTTDNKANYYNLHGGNWMDDYGRSNHFLYTENIHALYAKLEKKAGKWELQGGLRYEYTGYQARQLGNIMVKDSSFNRNYQSLFPSAFVTYHADSANSFTLRAGRRIDRPGFQKLNPFVYIINKYTFQQGNPFFKPQYSWNIELAHQYKDILSTGVSYGIIKDYFSQIFLADTSNGTVVYTEGNIGRMQLFGVSASVQVSPAAWWSLSGQANLNYKKIEGFVWNSYSASITQMTGSITNQFRFKKGWAAELIGIYTTRAQNDLQEVLEPTGQLSVGVSKQVLKNQGSVKLSLRDIFYTQKMEGLSYFQGSDEYFKLLRDSRVATVSFSYRFGKTMKSVKRSSGGATDEINRVGSGN
jgi:iron complex outermembrane recepter protein